MHIYRIYAPIETETPALRKRLLAYSLCVFPIFTTLFTTDRDRDAGLAKEIARVFSVCVSYLYYSLYYR